MNTLKLINVKTSQVDIKKFSSGWKLLLDGDMFIYTAAWASDKTSERKAKLALVFLVNRVLHQLDSDVFTFFTTSPNNHRNIVYPLYKSSRIGGDKPRHLAALQEFARKMFNSVQVDGYEADDLIALAHDKDRTIIVSNDKDFDQLPGFHNKINKKCSLYWVNKDEADLFFAKQCLTGDRIDDIPGLSERLPKRGIGPVKAEKLLTPWRGVENAYNVLLDQYKIKYGDDALYMLTLNSYLLKIGLNEQEVNEAHEILERL